MLPKRVTRLFAFFLSTVCCVLALKTVWAQDWPATATGRIESGEGSGTCSASLLAENIVVTAAHCLHPDKRVYVFRPGEGAQPGASYTIRQILRHPRYLMGGPKLKRQRYDMAVGLLDRPVPETDMRPITVGAPAIVGETLFLESWRRDHGPVPKRRACDVIAGADAFQVTLRCEVEMGESGAPVLRLGPDGPEFVAVVTARAQFRGQNVALAALAEHHFGLLAILPGQ